MVSASSATAPVLSDDNKYPNLARAATSESNGAGAANAAMAAHYGWKRVAILSDDSVWAQGASKAFTDAFKKIDEKNTIINENDPATMSFAVAKVCAQSYGQAPWHHKVPRPHDPSPACTPCPFPACPPDGPHRWTMGAWTP